MNKKEKFSKKKQCAIHTGQPNRNMWKYGSLKTQDRTSEGFKTKRDKGCWCVHTNNPRK